MKRKLSFLFKTSIKAPTSAIMTDKKRGWQLSQSVRPLSMCNQSRSKFFTLHFAQNAIGP